jgi:16S rRNA (cytidine1402-2'-O)-methyltransferase
VVPQAASAIANPTAIAVFICERLGAETAPADDRFSPMTNSSTDTDAKRAADRTGARGGSPPLEPGLYVVATPIGNLRDITLRALDILAGASRVYAEDTRVTRKLLDAYSLKPRLHSYHEHNAEQARAEILAALANGESIALVSDAGTPLISDPGFKLARAVLEAGFKVVPAPGASASLAALVASGLPSDRFLFAGFLSAKTHARRTELEELAEIGATLVFYESGPRLADSLADMAAMLGARPAAVARELTKMFEEVRRDTLDVLAAHYASAGAPKGEIVVVVGPPMPKAAASAEDIDALLRAALLRGGVKEAAAEAARELGVPRREAYARAVQLKDERA